VYDLNKVEDHLFVSPWYCCGIPNPVAHTGVFQVSGEVGSCEQVAGSGPIVESV
jgi:hypothetical protein